MPFGTDRQLANCYKHGPQNKGGHQPMVGSFDIFKVDSIGNVLWRDSAENLTAAEKRVATLSTVVPGEYLIFNQQTQERFVVGIAAVELLPITRQLAIPAETAHVAEQPAIPVALSQD